MAKLADLRQAKGWTQAQMANELGVSTNTVTRWEMDGENASRPPGPALRLLSAMFGVPKEEIEFGGGGEKRRPGRPRKSPATE